MRVYVTLVDFDWSGDWSPVTRGMLPEGGPLPPAGTAGELACFGSYEAADRFGSMCGPPHKVVAYGLVPVEAVADGPLTIGQLADEMETRRAPQLVEYKHEWGKALNKLAADALRFLAQRAGLPLDAKVPPA